MQQCFLRFVLWMTLAWPMGAWALSLERTSGIDDPVNLSGHLAARCVANDRESIEEISMPDRADEFLPLPALLLKGYTSDTCWLRFELQRAPDAPHDWFLEVGMPYLDNVTLYIPSPHSSGTSFRSLQLGDRFPYAERPIPHRLLIFPLHLADDQRVSAYMRIQTSSTMLVETLNLWQEQGLFAATQLETVIYGLVFGLIALGVLSNLVFWLWLREGVYRSYTVYLVTLLILNLVSSGFALQWIWPTHPLVADRSVGFMAALTYFVGLSFFDRVLRLRQYVPFLGRVIPFLLLIYVAGALAAAVGYWAAVAPVIQSVALTSTAGITLIGPWLLLRGQRHLWLYVLSFSTQLVVGIAALSRNLGVWPLEARADYFMLAATAIHVVLCNFALAERVRHTQSEKDALEKTATRLELEQLALKQHQDFMSMVAHEFRTPLSIIDTIAQRIAGQSSKGKEKTLERCSNIRNAVARLTSLMDEFLTIDRLEGQFRGFSPRQVRINDVIEAALAGISRESIDVRLNNLPRTIFCDQELLQVALTNLLRNALRFSPPGHQVQFTVQKGVEGRVVFSVTDDGPGIPADELPRIFEKYFRGRNSQTQPGAGLGLFLVAQVAQLHGGTTGVVSTPGGETCFTLTIPLSRAS